MPVAPFVRYAEQRSHSRSDDRQTCVSTAWRCLGLATPRRRPIGNWRGTTRSSGPAAPRASRDLCGRPCRHLPGGQLDGGNLGLRPEIQRGLLENRVGSLGRGSQSPQRSRPLATASTQRWPDRHLGTQRRWTKKAPWNPDTSLPNAPTCFRYLSTRNPGDVPHADDRRSARLGFPMGTAASYPTGGSSGPTHRRRAPDETHSQRSGAALPPPLPPPRASPPRGQHGSRRDRGRLPMAGKAPNRGNGRLQVPPRTSDGRERPSP
jgi:hypothetical protein